MFSAARPAPAELTRALKRPSTSWSSLSFAAIAAACSCAMRVRVESITTRPSPCWARKREIISAGESARASAGQHQTARKRQKKSDGFIAFEYPITSPTRLSGKIKLFIQALEIIGRGSWIRTNDLQYPKLPRYQAALYPEYLGKDVDTRLKPHQQGRYRPV